MSSLKEGVTASSHNISGSGSYKGKSTDASREKKQTTVAISVVLLDHSEVVFNVNKRDRGQTLLDLVFHHLRVSETKFFGLQFPNDVPDTMRWLDPTKSIRKQFRRGYPLILFFRIKFYATDIASMKDEFTRYQLFLQIRLDLLEKRLQCHMSVAAMIASYAIQSELGDYNQLQHKSNYVSGFKFLPNQTSEFEAEVQRLHKLHKGLTPTQAEDKVIKKAQKLDMYGVEIHHAKDNDEKDLDVGVTSSGMLLFQNSFRIRQYRWSAIVKISFKRKLFFVQLRGGTQMDSNSPELVYSFHMDNYRACKRLWKSCVDFHSFYRLDRYLNSSNVNKRSGKETSSGQASKSKSDKNLFDFFTLGGRPKYKDPDSSTQDDSMQHRHYLRSRTSSSKSKENLASSFDHDRSISDEKASRRLSAPPSVSYAVGASSISDEQMIAMLDKSAQSFTNDQKSRKGVLVRSVSQAESTESFEVLPSPSEVQFELHSPDPALITTFRPLHVRPQVIGDSSKTVQNDVDTHPASESASNIPITSQTEKSYVITGDVVLPFPHQPSNGIPDDLVVVRIKPDAEGRYGFNVKGGADQHMPVVVSKVAANSPASMCKPPLNEGDHVLQINGRDVSGHSHEQVVRFIRSTRENHSSQLVLVISPEQFKASSDDQSEFLTPMPVNMQLNRLSVQDEGALQRSSMLFLEDMLDSGELLSSFDSLYRKKPGSTMNDARLPMNASKNRYRDISPYDDTRVHLKFGATDYINANYVDMFIPGAEWVNHYVASQGPLLSTTVDFWAMVWELKATLIVMLTTVVERGRPKCHQYWPDMGMSLQCANWLIESVSEELTSSFAYRDFVMYECDENGEKIEGASEPRLIHQMQYIAWPDHGVPDDSSDFLDFVLQVRQNRVGMSVPTVVHCSAGIGRTGVLVAMETAMCLIEANQPVYPIEITRTMRDQRAMMIQTPGQFKFVCEAILRVYKEGLSKPLHPDDFDEEEASDHDDSDSNKASSPDINASRAQSP